MLVKSISIEERLAKNIVSHLIQRELTAKEEKILVYGWSVLLINLGKIFIIGAIAALLGIFTETLVMFVAYTLLRIYAYGFHAKSSLNCTLISIVVFNLLPFVFLRGFQFVELSNQQFIMILYGVFLINAFFIYKYCPSPTQRKDKWTKEDLLKKKYQALAMLGFIAFISLFIDSQIYASMVLLGVTMAVIFITPITKISLKNKEEVQ